MPASGGRSSPPAAAASEGRGLGEPLRYNDWRRVAAPALGAFTPELPVSVVVPYCAQPQELARTLAALEGQTYPRDLFEVVVVDDGSPQPLARPRSTPLDLKVARQEDRGFGLARARNTGARAAAHDVLLFLDADMLPEAHWLAAHARWHHMVPDAVTLGSWLRVAVDGVDAGMIRRRPGTLKELLAGRMLGTVEYQWIESHMARTDDLTSKAEDPFRVVASGNLGIRRGFYELVGGFDESFTQSGGEDTEFGYRAYVRGGLLVPARDAFAWHQGLGEEGRAEKERSHELQRAKLAHLIAHPGFRTGLTGRSFTVPQYVVTIEAGELPAKQVLGAVERVLSGPVHDLVVRLELPGDHAGWAWLERHLDPDPRVRVAPNSRAGGTPFRAALEEFPASPLHVALPAGRPLHGDVVRRLRAELGTAAIGRAVFPDGSCASIARAWALHRALRTPWQPADFGEAVTIPPKKLAPPAPADGSAKPAPAPASPTAAGGARRRAPRTAWGRLRAGLRQVDGPVAAWRFARWFAGAVPRRALRRFRDAPPQAAPAMPAEAPPSADRGAPASPPSAEYPLGVEIAALGARSRAVFAASRRVARTTAGQHIDLVVADTAAEAMGAPVPAVVLAEAPPMLSVPAFDPRGDNPIGWRRDVGDGAVGALGPLDRLPPGRGADRIVRRGDRTALREHSLASRARQAAEQVLADPPRPPLVSVLLPTRRPELLERALAAVRRQTYPRLELVLGLHGEGFGEVAPDAAGPSAPVTALRLDAALPLGSVLNAAAQASRGTLLAKMDDDDLYGPDHIWDLVLAHEYSQAPLVGKGDEFAYLAAADRTIRRRQTMAECYVEEQVIGGGALLIERHMLDHIGGWRRLRRHVDQALIYHTLRAGGRIYKTHSYGFLVIRHGRGHTWKADDAWFLERADVEEAGWRPEMAGISDARAPYPVNPREA